MIDDPLVQTRDINIDDATSKAKVNSPAWRQTRKLYMLFWHAGIRVLPTRDP